MTTASYTPAPEYSFSSTGGAITATRSAVGRYQMRFAGLATPARRGETVQVTPMGMTWATCTVPGWGSDGDDLVVTVECRAAAGAYVDTRYDLLVIE
jgi:hypothetical protein